MFLLIILERSFRLIIPLLSIFSLNSLDWMWMAQAAFTQNATVVTVYDTLGAEGLAYALNQGEIEILFTSAELMPIVKSIKDKVKSLKVIVYNTPEKLENPITIDGLRVLEINALMEDAPAVDSKPPKPEDLGCIMYTRGSTGNPKVDFLC